MHRIWIVWCGLMLAFLGAPAQEKPLAFKGAHLIPIAGAEIDNGLLVVHQGKIVYAGPYQKKSVPKTAEVINAKGKVIMPGLVDTHSHIGGVSGGDRSAPINPDARAMDSINVRSAGFQKAQAGGVTTANILPGSGHLMSGQTIYLKLRDGGVLEDLIIRLEDGSIAGGMKMANGTNSRRNPPFPGTRAKSAALIREQFVKAREYQKKLAAAKNDPAKAPARDLKMEALVELMERKRVVHHHTHRHDDIITVLRIAEEFNLEVVLHHVSEGWKVADEIAAAGASCSMILVDSPGGKLEARDLSFKTGAVLEKAGVLTAFHTDDGITDSRLFFRMAGLSVRYGMSRKAALEALTIAGAKMIHLDDRVGTLEKGKDADFLVMSGDPLSVYSMVEQTYIEGVKVFDITDPKDRLYAVGGYGASHDQVWNHVHDIGEEEGH
ncbi:MAG: amidohydrolase family protein [Acidobacteriota bacterium]|nr:amidohydrolase family protein [Acidobacteriota bacterium]